jgi:hypothetical protein
MKATSEERYARTCPTSDEKSKLYLYRPDGSVHYVRPESPTEAGLRSSGGLPIREIDFEEFADGRLAEIVEDPDDPKRTVLAVGRQGSYQLVRSVKCDKEILAPIPRDEILREVPLPRGVQEVRDRDGVVASREILYVLVLNFIRERVAFEPVHLFVVTSFIESTWFVDRLEVAPYLLIVGPPQSGKTTLLNVLALFCRRPLLVGDISAAALYRGISKIHPTLLIDESATLVGQSGHALRHFLRVGTTRQAVARRGEIFDLFGAKVFTALEPPDDAALNGRCIIVPMLAANPEKKDLRSPEVQRFVDALRQGLLRWRLDAWASIQPAKVPGSEALPPRTQDLLTSLAAAASTQLERDVLLQYFKETPANVDEDRRTVLSRLVNSILHKLIHGSTDVCVNDPRLATWIMQKDLTTTVNKELALRGERIRLGPEHVGHILTGLGLTNREKTNCGMRLWLDLRTLRRIHQNAKNYGQEELRLYYGPQLEACPLCSENSCAELPNKVPSAPESESTKSSDPTQNTCPAGSPKLDGTDNVAPADKTCRRRNDAHSRQPARSKRRGRAKK